jgi:probable F420-dependent oxidoreductase
MTITIDTTLDGIALGDVGAAAQRAEAAGAAAAWIGEVNSDPFLPMLLAAEHTERLQVGTSVAIAFARSPMTVAMTAYDLQRASHGRFVLGLGTQVKGHVTRRFSMPWSAPAARMREYVQALHAIWASWEDESRLDFAGEFYTHTLMTPMFRPPRHGYGRPEVMVAGVGERLVHVAGEVGDGLFVHPFSTPDYVRAHILPGFEAGLAASGRGRSAATLACALLTATGGTDEQVDAAAADARRQLAFYASTAAYRPVLAAHGWEDLQPRLAELVKSGRWAELAAVLPDEVLTTFALVGRPDEVAAQLLERWDGVLDRASLVAPRRVDDDCWKRIHDAVAGAGDRSLVPGTN